MANVLSTLLVELGINTAAFIDGVNKATYQAKAGAQQIGSALSSIGSSVARIGAQFGQFGAIVGASIGAVGSNISTLVRQAGNLSGIAGYLKLGTIGFTALGAGALTAGAAVIGIAVHASEAASKLFELSQSTGVAVKDLSGLNIIGQLVGISADSLARSLERMDRTALATAEGSGKATNAYRTLGISVKDANGKLRPTTELFGEIADKFSNMEDGATKTALAMQIFGRAGAEMIPVLNQGKEALQYWIDYGTRVGAVLNADAAAGAHAFHDELVKLELISQGVQNQLMIALLPAIDHIVASFSSFLEKGNAIKSFGESVGSVLVFLSKGAYTAALAWDILSIGVDVASSSLEKFINKHKQAVNIAENVATLGLHAIIGEKPGTDETDAEIDKRLQAAQDAFRAQFDAIRSAIADLDSTTITPPAPEKKRGTEEVPVPKPLTAFKPEKDYVGELVSKTELATAAEIAQAAAIGQTTAALLLEKATQEALQKVGETRETITERIKSIQQEEANEAEVGNVGKLKGLKEQEAALNRQLLLLDQAKDKLVVLYDTKAVAAFASQVGESFTKANEELAQTVADAQSMVDAVQQGGQAVADVQIDQKLEKQRQQLDSLKDAYYLLAGTQGVDQAQLDILAKSIDQASAALDQHQALLVKEHDLTIQTQEAHYNLTAQYRTELETLQEEYAVAVRNNDVMAEHLIILQNRDAWTKFRNQIDETTFVMGDLGQKFQSVLDQMYVGAQDLGKTIFKDLLSSIDNVNKQLAQMVVTGKADFTSLLQSFAEMLFEMSIKQAESHLASSILQGVFGIFTGGAGKLTSGDSFTPSFADVGTADIGHFAGGGDVSSSIPIVVGERGPEIFVPRVPGVIIPNVDGFGKSIKAMANGGSVLPGNTYLVGEAGHSEVFMPNTSSSGVPGLTLNVTHNINAPGADAGTLAMMRRELIASESRTVTKAVAAVQSLKQRRSSSGR